MSNPPDLLLKNLLTKKELKILQKRLQIIQFLKIDLTYREIAQKMGISTTTIVRLNQRLKIRKYKREKNTYKKTIVPKRLHLREGGKKLPWKIG